MQECSNCGHANRDGILFCENCGHSLTGAPAVGSTKAFDEQGPGTEEVLSAGSDVLPPNANLRIEIEGGPEPIIIAPKAELIFGRRDPATGAMPDIDLTPYAGYRMGVSRRHTAIRMTDDKYLDVWDLGSSNGTFLNGQRLNAHRPYRMHDGDRLRLGQMTIRVIFLPSEKDKAEGAAESDEVTPQEAETVTSQEASAVEAESTPSQETEAAKPESAPSQETEAAKPESAPSQETEAAKPESTPSQETEAAKPESVPNPETRAVEPPSGDEEA